jgi:salicylate hydroxylase
MRGSKKVGAGIQIPSNSSRLLLKWGLEPFLAPYVVEPSNIYFRRWEDGSVIGNTRLVPQFSENFGAPYYVIHRAHFHDALHRQALKLGVQVMINSRVEAYDPSKPSITLADGRSFGADLVVAADGRFYTWDLTNLALSNTSDKVPRNNVLGENTSA